MSIKVDKGSAGGGGGNSFGTIQTDAGTSPSADQANDTLTLTSSDSTITITGNSTTDTVTFNVGSSVYKSGGTDVAVADGGTGASTATAGFNALSPTTTKGDIIVNDGNDNIRLAVGTNNYVLTADSSTASGVKWAAASGGASGVDSINALIINPIDRTYVLDSYAPGSYTINSIGYQCSTGTCTLASQIDGVNVTSLSGLSVSSTPGTASASGANSVSAGNRVTAVVTSSSVIQDLEFSLKITRT